LGGGELPGWRRRLRPESQRDLERRREFERASRPASAPVVVADARAAVFRPGDRVAHPRFGTGEVLAVRPVGEDQRVTVLFVRVGRKVLYAEKARLRKLL